MTAACSLFGYSPDVFTVCIAEWTCGDMFRYSQSKFWLNEVYDDHECRSVGKHTKLTNNTTSKQVLDYLEMHKMCVWKYNMNSKDKWNIDERWINGCMSFGFTVGAYWAELVRFHPPQRHQQGEGTASVVRVVPSTTPHWCCKWVCCHVRFEKQLKWTLKPKRESTLELTKIKMTPYAIAANAVFLCAAGVQVQVDAPVRSSLLSTGARRAFFCRMKHSRVTGKHEDKHSLPSASKKKGGFRLESRLPNTFSACLRCHNDDMLVWLVGKCWF